MGKIPKDQVFGWGQSTWHHIISRSRDGPNIPENRYRWKQKKHQAYHQLFYNHLPSVVIKIIEEWTDERGNLDVKKMGLRNFKAWKRVFDKQKPAQVIEFIKERFLPVEKKFLKGELKGKDNGERKNGNRF